MDHKNSKSVIISVIFIIHTQDILWEELILDIHQQSDISK